jgi:prepilin-type N-terminal cleavage/methylation domain-containing protein
MRRGFTLLELIIAAAILGGVMSIISMSLRSATRVAAAIDVRGDLNTQAWNAVRTIADAVRNAQITSVDTANGILIYKSVTDLSGTTTMLSANATTVARVSVTEGGRTYRRLQTVTGTVSLPLAQEVATTFVPINSLILPSYGLTATSYPGFLIARIGSTVVIGVTLEQADPNGGRNPDGSTAKYRVSAMTQVMLRNL